ncbi:hypothetical protein [Kordia jejudonensis]|uniref:hypothetical protein n=1 Tax=Kordia jejudonensis TaxID=1348245 RepID=UPI0006291800|nr:hypothetical protein [Kordia jejudonensis]
MTNEEKLNSEEYFVQTVTTRIVETKKRLDRLVFLLILISAIGAIYYKNPPESFNFLVSKITPLGYHLGIVFGLLGVFALIGSKFIDYIIKRRKIDDYLLQNHFLLENYKRNFIPFPEEISENEIELNKLHYISRTVVPSSFYEFFYALFIAKKDLRFQSAMVLIAIFMFAHAVSIIHAIRICEGNWKFGAVAFLGIAYFVLYVGFINSIRKYREKLADKGFTLCLVSGIATSIVLLVLYFI